MQDGLGSGKTPAEISIHSWTRPLRVPLKERKQFALDAAKDAHIAWATDKGYEMWTADMDSVNLTHLKKQRDSIIKKDGEEPIRQYSFRSWTRLRKGVRFLLRQAH